MARRAMDRRFAATALAAFTASLGAAALVIEGSRSLTESLADGRSVAEALFLYLRFFTILTNIAVAALMGATAWRLARRQALPLAVWYNATLAYILVVAVTYEVLLRHLWSPHGLQLVTDTVLHDIVPALTLVFWILFAPRTGARWFDAFSMLAYPTGYFALTLAAGALGEGYPYGFVNVDELGLGRVLVVASIFVAVFFALGLATTAVARARPRRGASL